VAEKTGGLGLQIPSPAGLLSAFKEGLCSMQSVCYIYFLHRVIFKMELQNKQPQKKGTVTVCELPTSWTEELQFQTITQLQQ